MRRGVFVLLLAIAVAAFALAALATQFFAAPAWLPLGLSLAALGVAVAALAKIRLFEFAPEVLAGDVILPRSSRTSGDARFLLPLQFSNAGAADGIVEWVAVRLTIDGDTQHSVLLSPVAEIDMQRFLQAKRRLDPDNVLEPFTAFALEGRRSAAKFVLFDLAEKGRTPPLHLAPGRYGFELFVKSTAHRKPKLERTFEHVLDAKQVEEYRNDASVYLINYQISLPSARREIGGGEWLPRAARLSS
jgi:hypothetical protein